MTLLLVEDDPDIGAAMLDLLRFAGHDVFAATNGDQALELAREHAISLVLLDWELPGSTMGCALVRKLRAITGNAVPLVVFSAADRARQDARQEGIAQFLLKPFSMKELLDCIGMLSARGNPPPPKAQKGAAP